LVIHRELVWLGMTDESLDLAGTGGLSRTLPPSPSLSAEQIPQLATLGSERTANAGDVLFRVGDRRYPFVAILEGEVEVLDGVGVEIVRHKSSGFLGELSLLSRQASLVTAVASTPLRFISVDRDALRLLIFEDASLSDLLLSTFIARREALQQVDGLGVEIIGPRSSSATVRLVEFARANRLPFSWNQSEEGARQTARADPEDPDLPVVRFPDGTEMVGKSPGEVFRKLGVGRVLEARETADLLIIGAGLAGRTCGGRLRRIGGPRDVSHRIDGAGWTSRHFTEDRKLPGFSGRYRRISVHAPRGGSSS
jgi:thioredoxin reductase (NADPH)